MKFHGSAMMAHDCVMAKPWECIALCAFSLSATLYFHIQVAATPRPPGSICPPYALCAVSCHSSHLMRNYAASLEIR